MASSTTTAPKKTLMSLPDDILSKIFYFALPPLNTELQTAISNPKTMIRKHATPSAAPSTLYVNKRSHILAQNIWLNHGFTHIYLNSWNELPLGLLHQCEHLRFLALTLDIRNGARGSNEGLLRPSIFCAKIRDLLARMPNVEALFLRCWHGKNAINPVSRIVMNAFAGWKVGKVVNVTSFINAEDYLERVEGSGVVLPSALTTVYLRLLLGELLDRDPKSFDRKRFYRARLKKSRVVTISSGVAERDPGFLEGQMASMRVGAGLDASTREQEDPVIEASGGEEGGPTSSASVVDEVGDGKAEGEEQEPVI